MNNLRIFRTLIRMPQWRLAKLIGTNQATISLIESGKIIPGKELAERISQALNQPLEVLFGDQKADVFFKD